MARLRRTTRKSVPGGPYRIEDFRLPEQFSKALQQHRTLDKLVPPFANTSVILAALAKKKLDATDSVVLSGAHTIRKAHCSSFTDCLYPQDSTMDQTFAKNLKNTCPQNASVDGTTVQDLRTPDVFDNKYLLHYN
ncbi:hypothetical protein AgCh_018969 [Apium graveolens]